MAEKLEFYPRSRARMFWRSAFLLSLGIVFAACAALTPANDIQWWLFPPLAAFLTPLGGIGILYVANWKPWLVLDPLGFTCRASWRRDLRLRWNQVRDLRIHRSAASGVIGYRTVRFSVQFISVYLFDNESVLSQHSYLARLLGLLSVRMGYTPLSISQEMLDQPLDNVLAIMNTLRVRASPNLALQSDALASLVRA